MIHSGENKNTILWETIWNRFMLSVDFETQNAAIQHILQGGTVDV